MFAFVDMRPRPLSSGARGAAPTVPMREPRVGARAEGVRWERCRAPIEKMTMPAAGRVRGELI